MTYEHTLDNQLCFALYGASMVIGRLYKPMLDAMGITYPQYLVLFTLWEGDGRTIGAIAERLSLESSTITPLVKRMEAAGLVTRARSAEDERRVLVHLTDKGRSLQGESRCLGEALFLGSGMQPEELMALTAQARRLQQALARQLDEAPAALSADM
jgi:Transcriptional regulators